MQITKKLLLNAALLSLLCSCDDSIPKNPDVAAITEEQRLMCEHEFESCKEGLQENHETCYLNLVRCLCEAADDCDDRQ